MQIGELVTQKREALGLDRRSLADRASLSYPYVCQIETGVRRPSPRVVTLLAEALGMDAADLGGADRPHPPKFEGKTTREPVPLRDAPLQLLLDALRGLTPAEGLAVVNEAQAVLHRRLGKQLAAFGGGR